MKTKLFIFITIIILAFTACDLLDAENTKYFLITGTDTSNNKQVGYITPIDLEGQPCYVELEDTTHLKNIEQKTVTQKEIPPYVNNSLYKRIKYCNSD